MKIKRIYSGMKIRFVFVLIATFMMLTFLIITLNNTSGHNEQYWILPIVIIIFISPFSYFIDIYEDFIIYNYYFFIKKKIYIKDIKKIEYVFGIKAGEPTYSLKITLKNNRYVKINAKAFNSEDLKYLENFLQY